jgi:general stress protein YciG
VSSVKSEENGSRIHLRGFASMSPAKRKAIASKGGKAVQAAGKGHNWDSDEAREAGIKGGTAISEDRDHMAEIGRKGGLAKARNHKS